MHMDDTLALHACLLPQNERITGKAVYFVRTNAKGVNEKTVDADLAAGEVCGAALDNFRALIADLYLPIIQEQQVCVREWHGYC
jgi:dynein heavy chain